MTSQVGSMHHHVKGVMFIVTVTIVSWRMNELFPRHGAELEGWGS